MFSYMPGARMNDLSYSSLDTSENAATMLLLFSLYRPFSLSTLWGMYLYWHAFVICLVVLVKNAVSKHLGDLLACHTPAYIAMNDQQIEASMKQFSLRCAAIGL